ncbi:MAG: hypothetical protein LUF30_08570 [Lachnospiraceae bacterium]|nr:hypothetical protein [Lachnospiraceae bacterium]
MLNMKKTFLLPVLAVLLSFSMVQSVFADSASNFTYDNHYMNIQAPIAYEVEKVYYAADFEGMDSLSSLASMYVTDDKVYIATASAILVVDYDFNVVHILSEYETEDGDTDKISNPDGIFVKTDGTLYVCEPSNGRILVFDSDYQLIHNFGAPEGLSLDVAYKPAKIVVDSLGRMYVIATNVYEGILELSADNVYQRYFGTTTVSITPIQILYRMIASEEQLSRQSLILPTEYSSLAIDSNGFIYTPIQATDEEEPVRLLNVNGDDILPEDWKGDRPIGAVMIDETIGRSSLTYIDCNDYGMYMVVDSTYNQIFTYDESSNMLYVFGGTGDKDGCFRNLVSARWLGDTGKVICADKLNQSITVMSPTNYGQAIYNAVVSEYEGDRDTAVEYWQEALDMNAGLRIARDAIGRYLYWSGDYEAAMEQFEYIGRTDYYAKCFEKIREQIVRKNAPTFIACVAVVIVVIVVLRRIRRKRKEAKVYAA